jgi:hypothetical protein
MAVLATASRAITGLAPQRDPPHSRAPRQRLPMTYYAELAAEYVAALERGDQRPIQTMAAARGIVVHRVRDLLHRARVRGLLSASEPGRTGGALTPKARALLAPNAPPPTEAKPTARPATARKEGRPIQSRRDLASRSTRPLVAPGELLLLPPAARGGRRAESGEVLGLSTDARAGSPSLCPALCPPSPHRPARTRAKHTMRASAWGDARPPRSVDFSAGSRALRRSGQHDSKSAASPSFATPASEPACDDRAQRSSGRTCRIRRERAGGGGRIRTAE